MKQNKRRALVEGTWLLQILAISTSGLSIAAIGILLAHYNDQPIFDWNGITLNVILVVLSAISKTTLAFTLSECLGQAKWIWFSKERPLRDIDLIDSASRGLLGSFKILTQSIARSFISMGAMIIILSIAIDPFVQLTVGKREFLKYEESSKVQIAYAQRYDKGLFEPSDDASKNISYGVGLEHFLSLIGTDLGMQSAVTYGLSQPDSLISQQVQPSCPSGNCTWDTFMSLAVCSACKNLTNQISERRRLQFYGSELVIEVGLPNGLETKSTIPMSAYGSGNEKKSVSFTSYDTLIWSMTMINNTLEDLESLADFSAIECGLWYCVNSYKSVVKDGNLSETIEPTPSTRESDSWRPFVAGGVLEDVDSFYAFSKSINVFDKSTVIPFYNSSFRHPTAYYYTRRTDLQLGEGFNLSQTAIYSVSKLMNNIFAEPRFLIKGANAIVYDHEQIESHDEHEINSGRNYHPTAVQSLYHSQNVENTFAALARSMTNYIRQNSDNNTVIYGKEGKMTVVFRMQGRFLILPVILICGGVVFLAVTLYYTHKLKIPFWGTNALPIVALGGRLGSIFDGNDMMKTSTMEQQAKRLLVQLSILQSMSRIEDPVMASPARTSTMHDPSADVVSVISSSRTSTIHNPSADGVSVISSLHTSRVIDSSSLDAMRIVSNDDT